MKLCVVHINAEKGSEPYTEMIDGVFNRVKRSDVEVTHRYSRLRRATDTVLSYPYLLNTLAVVEELSRASDEGFDGAMVACSGDPGIAEARSISTIPIVGPFEATAHLAASYGQKFGIVTVEDRAWLEACEGLVVKSGMTSRCAGIRQLHTPSAKAFTDGFVDPSFVVEDIRERSIELVEDGANAIVVASAGLSTIAAVGGLVEVEPYGVPVFDVLSAGLKTLEMRVDMTQKMGLPVISRTGYMELLSQDDLQRIRGQFDMA